MVIFGDPVTPLQFFGYSIALGGLVYYKLGADKMKDYLFQGQRMWGEYGAQKPAQRKMVIFGGLAVSLLLFLGFIYSGRITEYGSSVIGS